MPRSHPCDATTPHGPHEWYGSPAALRGECPGLTCVFCAIVAEEEPAKIVRRWADTIAIVPLNPVTEGHLLVIPTAHVTDHGDNLWVTATTAQRAAQIAPYPSNLITSAGEEDTQTIRHLHFHVVPRRAGDGLALPWTGGGDSRG